MYLESASSGSSHSPPANGQRALMVLVGLGLKQSAE